MVVLIAIGTIGLTILIVYGVRKHLEELRKERQREKEAATLEDLKFE